jgi:hypothetical protein
VRYWLLFSSASLAAGVDWYLQRQPMAIVWTVAAVLLLVVAIGQRWRR